MKRILAVIVSLVMINSVIDYSGIIVANAKTGENESVKVITAVRALAEEVAYQNVPMGTKETDLLFPDTLTVTVSGNNVTKADMESQTTTVEPTTTESQTTTVEPTTKEPQTTAEVHTTEATSTPEESSEQHPSADITPEPSSQDLEASVLDTILSFGTLKAYAKENNDNKEADTETNKDEITLEGITWSLDVDNSAFPAFDGGTAVEDYFTGFDSDGEAIETDTETWEGYFKKNARVNGAAYTYVPNIPTIDSEGTSLQLEEGVTLPTIRVMVGDGGIMLLSETGENWTDGLTAAPNGYAVAGDTITITTAEALAWVSVLSNGLNGQEATNFSNITVKLGADIDLSGKNWIPIANKSGYGYCGNFNGQGYTISNLSVTEATNDMSGLFGQFKQGTLENAYSLCDSGKGGSIYAIEGEKLTREQAAQGDIAWKLDTNNGGNHLNLWQQDLSAENTMPRIGRDQNQRVYKIFIKGEIERIIYQNPGNYTLPVIAGVTYKDSQGATVTSASIAQDVTFTAEGSPTTGMNGTVVLQVDGLEATRTVTATVKYAGNSDAAKDGTTCTDAYRNIKLYRGADANGTLLDTQKVQNGVATF